MTEGRLPSCAYEGCRSVATPQTPLCPKHAEEVDTSPFSAEECAAFLLARTGDDLGDLKEFAKKVRSELAMAYTRGLVEGFKHGARDGTRNEAREPEAPYDKPCTRCSATGPYKVQGASRLWLQDGALVCRDERLCRLRRNASRSSPKIIIVEAPGDRCGGSRVLLDGERCPGCRACA